MTSPLGWALVVVVGIAVLTCLLGLDCLRGHAGLATTQDVAGDGLELVVHPGPKANHTG